MTGCPLIESLRRVPSHAGPHTIPFARSTPILKKDFRRWRLSPSTPRSQSPPATPFDSTPDAFELRPDVPRLLLASAPPTSGRPPGGRRGPRWARRTTRSRSSSAAGTDRTKRTRCPGGGGSEHSRSASARRARVTATRGAFLPSRTACCFVFCGTRRRSKTWDVTRVAGTRRCTGSSARFIDGGRRCDRCAPRERSSRRTRR